MKVEEGIVRDILRDAIAVADLRNKTFKQQFFKLMNTMYNIPIGDSVFILNNKLPVETMTKDTMYKLMKVLHHFFQTQVLETERYFTEIEDINFGKKILDEEIIKEVVITNWIKVNEDQYLCTMQSDYVNRLRDSLRFKYNENTQRSMTVKERGETIIKQVTLVPEARKAIHALMENNDFISDDLTLNINPDFYEPPKIIRGNLVIPEESVIDIIDGFHRYLEMTAVKDENPDWEYTCIFNIVMFNEDKANKFIIQRDKKNHLTEEQVVMSNKTDLITLAITNLNNSDNFHLKGSIDKEMFLYLHRMMIRLFNKNNNFKRHDMVQLYKDIEKNINKVVEEYQLYSSTLTKDKWFIYLYVMKHCANNELNFINVIKRLNIEEISKQMNFKKEPLDKHYAILYEVTKNV